MLGRIENPALDFWYHICLDLDTSKDTVSAAVNGAVVGQDVDLGGEGMAAEMAKELKNNLVVGKWNYTFEGVEEQFVWSVTNLEIFKPTTSQDLATLTNLPSRICPAVAPKMFPQPDCCIAMDRN